MSAWKKVPLSGEIENADINASADIVKTKISHSGTWAVSEIPDLTAAKISDFASTVESNSAVSDNTAKETNATHSGHVHGSGVLTIQSGVVTDDMLAGSINPIKISGLSTALGLKAPLESPDLTGNPTAPTQSVSDVSTKIATTEFVERAVSSENELSEMEDVILGSQTDHEVLAYDEPSEKWVNMTAAEAGLLTTSGTAADSDKLGGTVAADYALQSYVASAVSSHNTDEAHREIDDGGSTLVDLWSASKITSELATKIGSSGVTYGNLSSNGDVGPGSAQVAQGNHNHTGTYALIGGDINQAFACKDLTVSGTTTTVNTEEILLEDNLITLNSNYTGSSPDTDAGFEVERGTLPNAVLHFNELNNDFRMGFEGETMYRVPAAGSGTGTPMGAIFDVGDTFVNTSTNTLYVYV